MIYLKRSNPAAKKNRLTISVVALFLAVLFGIHFFFPLFYPSLFYPIASLAWKTEKSLTGWFADTIGLVRSKYSLERENQRLRGEIISNEVSLLLLAGAKRENDELKAILGRRPEGDIILASVLVRPPVSPYDTLVIDAGSNDGVEVGDLVFADGDVLVGEIAEVYRRQSKVALFSTPGKKINVSLGEAGVRTEAVGRGGGNFSASVPSDAEIKESDTVIFSDMKLHTLGVIEKITIDSAGSFSIVLWKIPVNINEIRFVEVKTGQ